LSLLRRGGVFWYAHPTKADVREVNTNGSGPQGRQPFESRHSLTAVDDRPGVPCDYRCSHRVVNPACVCDEICSHSDLFGWPISASTRGNSDGSCFRLVELQILGPHFGDYRADTDSAARHDLVEIKRGLRAQSPRYMSFGNLVFPGRSISSRAQLGASCLLHRKQDGARSYFGQYSCNKPEHESYSRGRLRRRSANGQPKMARNSRQSAGSVSA